MNALLRKGILSALSLILFSGFILLSPTENCNFTALAQAKKKPPAKPSQRQGGPNLNTAAINSYLSGLRDKLDQYWDLADGKNRVTLTATVASDGIASDLSISSAPSNQQAEQAANEAFAKAQPMGSLPAGAGERVKLTVIFESYADPHGDSNRNITTKMDPMAAPPKPE